MLPPAADSRISGHSQEEHNEGANARDGVNYYGVPTPLAQVASLSVPESRTITIQPWDSKMTGEIEKAIQKSDLGLTPLNDGKTVRINIPPLTE